MTRTPFRRIAIVGVGLIGGSLALALRRRVRRARVIGVDRAAVLVRALRRGALHEGTTSLARGLAGADLVVVAVPVDAALRLLPRIAALASPEAIVTDVGGVKGPIARAAAACGLRDRFVGGHPMAGTEHAGVDHADGALFEAAPWLLCPPPAGRGPGAGRRRSPAALRIAALLGRIGARPSFLPAADHDRIVARLSHLPQLASVALTNAAARGGSAGALLFAGPALRGMSRLAVSPPSVWMPILRANRIEAGRSIDDLIGELRGLRRALRAGPVAAFRRAARTRARMMAHGGAGT